MKITLDDVRVLLALKGYNTLMTIFYGSAVIHRRNVPILTPEPRDIDVILVTDDDSLLGEYTETLYGVDVPVNITYMRYSTVMDEVKAGEMKYFNAYVTYDPDQWLEYRPLYTNYITKLLERDLSEFRRIGSSAADKAFNKGKKKLTVPEDFDRLLGLKNLYHSVCFPLFIQNMHKTTTILTGTEVRIINMLSDSSHMKMAAFWDDLEYIFDTTPGTDIEKGQATVKFAKTIYNSNMTEFRKHFPKG